MGLRRMIRRGLATAFDFGPTRRRFEELEALYSAVLDKDRLTAEELTVDEAHRKAVRRHHFTYDDPITGEKVYTRYFHFLHGKCCGRACRHCTFNLEGVPKNVKKQKVFNTSFWKDNVDKDDQIGVMKLWDLIKVKPKEPSTCEAINQQKIKEVKQVKSLISN